MTDRILLLPDNIANQIAAGEVIQRPASAVKELLENAVDAGATEIRLVVNDAGKSLIQVIDNGSGMSEADARMAFERHATSKIRHIDDLFHIRTMGFRGEALASIAAVAQVELRTRRAQDETGTCIEIENSTVLQQEPVATPEGTSICIRNLFFNIPARRNFLKSNAAEMRHMVDEFVRVSLSFPDIFFSFTSNGQQLFHLDPGPLKQRVLQILGAPYASRLVHVKEETAYLNIEGFVGKPDTAKKTRGDQYFFVNRRFIKSPYLNHAVQSAYQDMVPADSFPLYILFIDLDPAQLDVNVHPTKQEVKFEDEKIVYAFVQAAVKHALAQFSITPALDFNLDAGIQQLPSVQRPFTTEQQRHTRSSSIFQAFTEANQAHKIEGSGLRHWSELRPESWELPPSGEPGFVSLARQFLEGAPASEPAAASSPPLFHMEDGTLLTQLFNSYILLEQDHGFLLFHQQAVHERVIYERLVEALDGQQVPVQRSLFPVTLELSVSDAVLLEELIPDLTKMGYFVEPFGKNAFVVQGTPADTGAGQEKAALEKILEQYKHFTPDIRLSKREILLRTVAAQQAVRAGTSLSRAEMQALLRKLLACASPNGTPTGRPTFLEFRKDQLEKMFGR